MSSIQKRKKTVLLLENAEQRICIALQLLNKRIKIKTTVSPNLECAGDELPLRCEVVDLVVSRVGHGLVVAAPEDGRGGEGLKIKGNIIFMGK